MVAAILNSDVICPISIVILTALTTSVWPLSQLPCAAGQELEQSVRIHSDRLVTHWVAASDEQIYYLICGYVRCGTRFIFPVLASHKYSLGI
jgi:hypothetical protein